MMIRTSITLFQIISHLHIYLCTGKPFRYLACRLPSDLVLDSTKHGHILFVLKKILFNNILNKF